MARANRLVEYSHRLRRSSLLDKETCSKLTSSCSAQKMEDIKKSLEILETIELQILRELHKITNGNSSEGQKDIEKIARKSKAACKSIKIKLKTIEKDMKNLQDENKKLREENRDFKNCKMELTTLRKEKTAMRAELNKSQSVISNYISDCLHDNKTTSDKEENDGESQSQDLFEPTAKKAKID